MEHPELWQSDAHGSLCHSSGCTCHNTSSPAMVDVRCNCHHKQILKIGLLSRVSDASQPPANTGSLLVENCHHVELYSRLVNHMKNIQNITIRNTHTVVIHPKLYEAKGAATGSGTVHNIEMTNIHKLQVKRYSFKDMEVTNRFYLGEVNMASVVSMAFDFQYVKEFSVFASKFDRISMFGIKLALCKEFNVLGMTHFASLAAHAIKVKCDKFSLAYNWFGHLHDSSFDVEYGLCDIQGNTFVSLGGKPFLNMRPHFSLGQEGANEIAMMGLVFRENKFASEPVLPFASLAMPSFSLLSPTSSYLDIDSNQFPCSCQRLGWLLAFGKFGYNSHSLAEVGNTKGSGTTSFIKELYKTAGKCIECDHRECRETEEELDKYGDNILVVEQVGGVACGVDGVTIENYDINSDTIENFATHQPLSEVEEFSKDSDNVGFLETHANIAEVEVTTEKVPNNIISEQVMKNKLVRENPDKVTKEFISMKSSVRRQLHGGHGLCWTPITVFFTSLIWQYYM